MNIFSDMIEMQVSLKLNCVNILAAMHGLLASLLSVVTVRKDKYAGPSLGERDSKQVFQIFLLPMSRSSNALPPLISVGGGSVWFKTCWACVIYLPINRN